MSHSISSLAWTPRTAAALPQGTGRPERLNAAAPTPPAAPVARLTAPQELTAAVQTAATPATGATATPTEGSEAQNTVQRFAQALMFALHRMGHESERKGDDEGHHGRRGRHGDNGDHGRSHGHAHGHEHGRGHEGLRAYRSMDSMARRLGDLATRLRQGATPTNPSGPMPPAVGTPSTPAAPAGTPPTPAANGGATPVEPVIDTMAPTPTSAVRGGVAVTTGMPKSPALRADPLQRLLDAFSAMTSALSSAPTTPTTAPTTAPAATPTPTTTPTTDTASPRERLAGFLDQLASMLSAPGHGAANDACGCPPKGSLLNLAA